MGLWMKPVFTGSDTRNCGQHTLNTIDFVDNRCLFGYNSSVRGGTILCGLSEQNIMSSMYPD